MANHQDLWSQVTFVRARTLQEVQEITEMQADHIPEGFNNSIRWNLGHIGTIQAQLVNGYSPHVIDVPAHYETFFAKGTSPAEWEKDPPSLNELQSFLNEQTNQLQLLLTDELDQKLTKPFPIGKEQIETIDELLRFSLYHEGLHTGVIKGLKKTIGTEK